MIHRHLAPHFQTTAIDRIKARRCRGLHRGEVTCRPRRQDDHQPPQLRPRRVPVRAQARVGDLQPSRRMPTVPAPLQADPDIRFLTSEELEALLRAVPLDGVLGPTDHALYMIAAMTGLRQGELVALRWRDIDWPAGVVRVRRNYSRGQWGTPKSRRSSRAVPLADRVAAELERHFQRSAYSADDDLVFCHPHTGNPYDASKPRERASTTR